jgi:hypothetical protein
VIYSPTWSTEHEKERMRVPNTYDIDGETSSEVDENL